MKHDWNPMHWDSGFRGFLVLEALILAATLAGLGAAWALITFLS